MSKEEELKALESQLNSLNDELNSGYQREHEFEQNIKRIQREADLAIQDIKEKQDSLFKSMYTKRKEVNSLKQKREFFSRQNEEEKRQQALLDRFNELRGNLEDAKKRYYWSEKIMKHQIEAAEFGTLRKRMINADVMGLGKTLEAIASCDLIKAATEFATEKELYLTDKLDRFPVDRPCGKKILYLSSSELSYGVWDEWKKWAPHRNVVFLTGFNKIIRRVVIDNLKNMGDEYVVILNYEAWRKDLNLLPLLSQLDFDTVIIDEAHKLKDRNSVSFRGVHSILSSTPSYFRFPMTGSPILNKPQELFSILVLVDPWLFYDEKQFLDEYCMQIEDDEGRKRWTFRPGGVELLYKKIGQTILRRTKEQVGINLPEKTITHHNLELDEDLYPDQARARREMRLYATVQLDPSNHDKGYISAAAQIAVLTRLRQIETWPAGIIIRDPITKQPMIQLEVREAQKLDYILNPIAPMGLLTDALESEERVVIFSQFIEPLKELQRRCKEFNLRSALFIGDTPRHIKEEIKEDFDASKTEQKNCKYDILLAHYKIGGEGLNFTGASQMIILDEEWNPGKRDQAYDRIHRIGQQKPITIHVLRCIGTIDEWMAKLIEFKEEMVSGAESVFSSNAAFKALKDGKI